MKFIMLHKKRRTNKNQKETNARVHSPYDKEEKKFHKYFLNRSLSFTLINIYFKNFGTYFPRCFEKKFETF